MIYTGDSSTDNIVGNPLCFSYPLYLYSEISIAMMVKSGIVNHQYCPEGSGDEGECGEKYVRDHFMTNFNKVIGRLES